MDYMDRSGKLYKENTGQDKLLRWMYTSGTGRRLLSLLVQPLVSEIGGLFLKTHLSALLVPGFVKRNGIRLEEYEKQRFSSYNDFFTRRIRPEKRPVCMEEGVLVSPCDGRVTVCRIAEDSSFYIKGMEYSLKGLLRDYKAVEHFQGGTALILRLCVDNYHHYCYPASGEKSKNRRIPGLYHTVNPAAVEQTKVYHENTREYCFLRTERLGILCMMEVGALMVGKISNRHPEKRHVMKGEEKGYFEFGGSTIVLLLQKGKVRMDQDLVQHSEEGYETMVKMGERIGEADG